jgi:hypothetical protein
MGMTIEKFAVGMGRTPVAALYSTWLQRIFAVCAFAWRPETGLFSVAFRWLITSYARRKPLTAATIAVQE